MVSYLICFQNQKALSYFQGFFLFFRSSSPETFAGCQQTLCIGGQQSGSFHLIGRLNLSNADEMSCETVWRFCATAADRQQPRVLDSIVFFALQLQRTFFHHFSF